MKQIFCLFVLFSTLVGLAQPGPRRANLNEIREDNRVMAEIIVIDSATELSKIIRLKGHKRLWLDLAVLPEIPKEFKGFTTTENLTLIFYQVTTPDLSFLNEFPNLKTLRIHEYKGKTLSLQKLKLDSLQYLEISYCENLNNIDAIKDLNQLENLEIQNVANLKAFPKFSKNNTLKKLSIDHMSNGRIYNDAKPKNYKTDIRNIKHLTQLEELTLGSLTYLDSIPNYLPRNITKLKITAWALHHWVGDKMALRNFDNLALYRNLKEISFNDIHIKEFKGNFKGLKLTEIKFWHIPELKNLSGVFSFDSIEEVRVEECHDLEKITGTVCNNYIETFRIEYCNAVKNIDFLFKCQKLKTLIFHPKSHLVKLPSISVMDKIPSIYISSPDDGIKLYKTNHIWDSKIINHKTAE